MLMKGNKAMFGKLTLQVFLLQHGPLPQPASPTRRQVVGSQHCLKRQV